MSDASTFCPACETETVPGAAYCHRCGTPVSYASPVAGAGSQASGMQLPVGGTGSQSAETELQGAGTGSQGAEGEGGAGTPASENVPPFVSGQEPGGPPRLAHPGPHTGESRGWEQADRAESSSGTASGAAGPAPAAGVGALSGPDEALARARRGEYPISIGDWMSRGWAVFTQAGGLFIGFAAIGWALFALTWTTGIFLPFLIVLSPMVTAGCFVAALIVRREGKVRFSDFWLPFHDFLPLFLAGLISWALLLAGLCTCGIVTVYLWVGYQFAYMLILDRRMDFWDALETSRAVVTTNWLALFAFAVLLLVLNVVGGLLTLSLGLVVTVPLTCCALVEAYADIFGIRGGMPGPPPRRSDGTTPPPGRSPTAGARSEQAPVVPPSVPGSPPPAIG